MTKTIQTALAPLLKICFFCGLGYSEYSLKRPYFTCLYLLIIWSLYLYLFYYLIYTSHAIVFFTFLNQIKIFALVVTMLVNLLRYKELKICLHKLSIANDTLEVLGTLKDYGWLHKMTIQIIIIWIVLYCLLNTLDIFWLNIEYSSVTPTLVALVENYISYINFLTSIVWGIILRYIGSKFQQINEHLKNLIKDDKYIRRKNLILSKNDKKSQREIKAYQIKKFMWILMHVHLQLCIIIRKLNKIFDIPITLQMASFFVCFVDMSCLVYTAYINRNTATLAQVLDGSFTFIWGFVRSTKLLMLNVICQTIYDKTNKTIAILYKLSNNSFDENLREQVLQFILQIKQRNLQLSGMGLFCFGCDFIRQFYVSVATVVVIIIQMHITYNYIYITPSIPETTF